MKPTPDLCDDYPDQVQVLAPILRNFGGRSQFCGPIVTVSCPEDNSKVKELLATPGEGRVLVVDGNASQRCAYLGDMLAAKASSNGWSGIVINGYIRDVDQIEATDIGVQALGTFPVKTEKRGLGDFDLPVTFGGITFSPGHYLYADNNGIVVAKSALAD